jgi:D-alanine-D-alanine ligase
MKKNLLLIYGGGSTEHEVSIISAQYLKSQIDDKKYNIVEVEITHDGTWKHYSDTVEINFQKELVVNGKPLFEVDIVIPCLHGFPGETGDLQSFLEMIGIAYIGCNSETSKLCFNKISTKLWLEAYDIATTPFLAINSASGEELLKVEEFQKIHSELFIKASNQGSSVGCFPLKEVSEIADTVVAALALSPYVVVEKSIEGRELEVSVFSYNNEVHATVPGEIVCPTKFYSYEEKYADKSDTKTMIEAENITPAQVEKIKEMAIKAYHVLKLRHLSRIDFFLTNQGEIYINEINTFPGMTPISMFPKMMENYGVQFKDFLSQTIDESIRELE